MSVLKNINKKFREFFSTVGEGHKELWETSKPEDEQCPVCGYYCTGNGGVGCINKPDILDDNDPPQGGSGIPNHSHGIAMEMMDNKALLKDDDTLYVCPEADRCELDIKEDCTHKVPHEWNFNCPNELHTTDGKMIENHKCPLKGCIEIPAVDIAEAAKKVADEMIAMPDDEFNEEIRKAKEEEKLNCQPDTCHGECQGNGWCEIAQQWQERIHPSPNAIQQFVGYKKRKKRKREKNEFWKDKRSKRKKKKMKHKRKLKRNK